ncbi:MAG: hypothetical protein C4542_02925 [Dehalococcoidia bacterium]|nr:MAG: hypothetical protein C4542_02925 [Dehalococcoidia bacterium]
MPKEKPTTTAAKQAAIPFPGDLRDYFAGQALPSALAHEIRHHQQAGTELDPGVIAEWVYGIADALLAEREKEN